MSTTLIPAETAIACFFPQGGDIYQCFSAALGMDQNALVLLAEGDLILGAEGLLQTERLVPDLIDAMGANDQLVGIVVTGNLIAPKATLLEPDIDWSPRIKVFGNLTAENLCLGGGVVEVGGDLTVGSTIFGFYNHGVLRVAGHTRADVLLSSDYTMKFSGEVSRRFALGSIGRMSIPIDFADETLGLAIDPDMLNSYGSLKDGEIIKRLSAGGSILKPESEIGRVSAPRLSKAGWEKLDAIAARAKSGEVITDIDLTGCDLSFVPEDIRVYQELRVLRLSKNNIKILPDWIGYFSRLEILAAEDCGLTTIPAELAVHSGLRELDISYNKIDELPLGEGAFPALEKLVIGRGWSDAHVEYVANLDLAQFPKLRMLDQGFSNLRELAFNARARLWNVPTLEYFDFGAVFDEIVPAGLAEATGLRGLSCSVAPQAIRSAIDVFPKFPQLEVLTLSYGTELRASEVVALYDALPGIYLRIYPDAPFDAARDDRGVLCKELSRLLSLQQYADAGAVAERLFAAVDFDRPALPVELFESAMQDGVRALAIRAANETDPVARRHMIEQSVSWADRVLARLPKTPDVVWWTGWRLGLMRLDCLLAKADGLLDQGTAAANTEARILLDIATLEAERHASDKAHWLAETHRRIGMRWSKLD